MAQTRKDQYKDSVAPPVNFAPSAEAPVRGALGGPLKGAAVKAAAAPGTPKGKVRGCCVVLCCVVFVCLFVCLFVFFVHKVASPQPAAAAAVPKSPRGGATPGRQ